MAICRLRTTDLVQQSSICKCTGVKASSEEAIPCHVSSSETASGHSGSWLLHNIFFSSSRVSFSAERDEFYECIHGKAFAPRTETRSANITLESKHQLEIFQWSLQGRYHSLLWNCNQTTCHSERLHNILRKVSWYLRSQDWKLIYMTLKAVFLWPLL